MTDGGDAAPAAAGYRAGARRQIGPLALTILLHIIALALLFFYKSAPIPRFVEQSLNTVFLPEAGEDKAEPAKAEAKQEDKAQDSEKVAQKQLETPPEKVTPVEPPPIPIGPNWLTMSREEFAAADISKMARASKGSDSGEQADSSSTYGPGEGPGGVRLYNADWFRRPTRAELAGYIPARAPSRGWGLIACQTMPRNRVDNCEIMGESPLGSGFGRAVREAAWQFLVLPPRINGKPMVGSWVRIRIEYGVDDQAG
ncbi:MAG: hypothetical protein J0G94_15085 [Sphingomonadales bacterium]|nr:hypothetical protein [Sphingomonadales bacterium]